MILSAKTILACLSEAQVGWINREKMAQTSCDIATSICIVLVATTFRSTSKALNHYTVVAAFTLRLCY